MDSRQTRYIMAWGIGMAVGLGAAYFLSAIVWWLGALVGGVAFVLIWALPDIVHYTSIAARDASRNLFYLPVAYGWFTAGIDAARNASSLEKWRTGYGLLLTLFVVVWLFSILLLIVREMSDNTILAFITMGGGTYFLLNYMFTQRFGFDKSQDGLSPEQQVQFLRKSVLFISVIGLPILVVQRMIWLYKQLPTVGATLYEIGPFLKSFARSIFNYIYSRELVAGFSGVVGGVLVLYPVLVLIMNLAIGPAMIFGGVIGLLFGFVSYRIVSKKRLHLTH